MRTLLVGVSVAFLALAISPADARYYRHHHYSQRNYSQVEARYESALAIAISVTSAMAPGRARR